MRPGRIRLPGGEGDPLQGGIEVGGAQVLAGRHGDDHLPHGMPRTGAGLAVAPGRASRKPQALTALTAGLARGLSTTGASGRRALLLRRLHTGSGNESASVAVPNVRHPSVEQDLQTGRSVQGTNGGAKMEQCKNKTNKLDEIHRNSYKIDTNFVRISQRLNMHTHSFT